MTESIEEQDITKFTSIEGTSFQLHNNKLYVSPPAWWIEIYTKYCKKEEIEKIYHQLLQGLKVLGIVEKKFEELSKLYQKMNSSKKTKNWDLVCKIQDEVKLLQSILEESKK